MYNNTSSHDHSGQRRKRDASSFYAPSNPPNYRPNTYQDAQQTPPRAEHSNFVPLGKAPQPQPIPSYAPQRSAPSTTSSYSNGPIQPVPNAANGISRPHATSDVHFYAPHQYPSASDTVSNSYPYNPQQAYHSSPNQSIARPPIPSTNTSSSFVPLTSAPHPTSLQPPYYEPPQQNNLRPLSVTEQHTQRAPPPVQPPQFQHPQISQQQPSQAQALQNGMAFVFAGMQQMASGGAPAANVGAQLFQTLAPGAMGYGNQLFGQGQERVNSFMKMPKYYFAVNHMYVLKKLALLLAPFRNRTWGRQRGMDAAQFEVSGSDGATSYLPPRDDVNAPDLYIPVMSFLTYVLLVGFVFGMQEKFKAEILARYFSRGLGVLTLEVLIIKLGLYLINARPTPWLDVIAYRGYKFVGVVLTMLTGILVRRLYYPVLLYSATAMGIFLMRSHRRIILSRDMDSHQAQDLARRNLFLLFLSVLQYPVYWVLVLDPRS
ncbi:YIF1 [Gracilaria domingensis]|nr:YIF1 [Gracilaria domingensis]